MSTNMVTIADIDELEDLRKRAVECGHPAVAEYMEQGIRQIVEFATLIRAGLYRFELVQGKPVSFLEREAREQ